MKTTTSNKESSVEPDLVAFQAVGMLMLTTTHSVGDVHDSVAMAFIRMDLHAIVVVGQPTGPTDLAKTQSKGTLRPNRRVPTTPSYEAKGTERSAQ